MIMEIKKRKTGDGILFVFQFATKEEYRENIRNLKICSEYFHDDEKSEYQKIIEKIEDRCNDKYSNDKTALSSALFPDEVMVFVPCINRLISEAAKGIKYKKRVVKDIELLARKIEKM